MSRRWARLALLAGALACARESPPPEQAVDIPPPPPDQEPPVALNADAPIQYPPRLFDQKVEGDVVLRLFVDSTGRLVPESSRVAESSGYPALDSAALAGAKRLRYAQALRRGIPVATPFYQPIEFRHPQADATRGTSPQPPPAPASARRPAAPAAVQATPPPAPHVAPAPR